MATETARAETDDDEDVDDGDSMDEFMNMNFARFCPGLPINTRFFVVLGLQNAQQHNGRVASATVPADTDGRQTVEMLRLAPTGRGQWLPEVTLRVKLENLHQVGLCADDPGSALEELVTAETGELHAAALRSGLARLAATAATLGAAERGSTAAAMNAAATVNPTIGVLNTFARASPPLRALLLHGHVLAPLCAAVADERLFAREPLTSYAALRTLCAVLSDATAPAGEALRLAGPAAVAKALVAASLRNVHGAHGIKAWTAWAGAEADEPSARACALAQLCALARADAEAAWRAGAFALAALHVAGAGADGSAPLGLRAGHTSVTRDPELRGWLDAELAKCDGLAQELVAALMGAPQHLRTAGAVGSSAAAVRAALARGTALPEDRFVTPECCTAWKAANSDALGWADDETAGGSAAAGAGADAGSPTGCGSPAGAKAPCQQQMRVMCRACSASGEAGAFKRCAGCGIARYCSRECQKGDWPSHKAACRSAQAHAQHMGMRPKELAKSMNTGPKERVLDLFLRSGQSLGRLLAAALRAHVALNDVLLLVDFAERDERAPGLPRWRVCSTARDGFGAFREFFSRFLSASESCEGPALHASKLAMMESNLSNHVTKRRTALEAQAKAAGDGFCVAGDGFCICYAACDNTDMHIGRAHTATSAEMCAAFAAFALLQHEGLENVIPPKGFKEPLQAAIEEGLRHSRPAEYPIAGFDWVDDPEMARIITSRYMAPAAQP